MNGDVPVAEAVPSGLIHDETPAKHPAPSVARMHLTPADTEKLLLAVAAWSPATGSPGASGSTTPRPLRC